MKVGDVVCSKVNSSIRGVVQLIDLGCLYVHVEGQGIYYDHHSQFRLADEPKPAVTISDCPECHGSGSVMLFTSVAACSRGCGG